MPYSAAHDRALRPPCRCAAVFAAAALLCIVALAGCSAPPPPPPPVRPAATKIVVAPPARAAIPLPDEQLLVPPQEPACQHAAANGVDARAQLDYERQCYRHAEIIVRERLQALQAAIADTIRAVRRGE